MIDADQYGTHNKRSDAGTLDDEFGETKRKKFSHSNFLWQRIQYEQCPVYQTGLA
jgi:hypothetical protein